MAADQAAGSAPPRAVRWWNDPASPRWPLATLGLLLAFQLSMVFTRAINWDEFWYYYHVEEFAQGRLAEPLQSLHVRLFAWLPALPLSSVTKVLIARLFMLACEVATLAAIVRIAGRFVGRAEALSCALLYLAAGFVFQHGFSFRTDPMIIAACMWAMATLLRSRLRLSDLLAMAALLAVSLMISIKIVLLLPAFAGIAWLRWREADGAWQVPLRIAAMLVGAVGLTGALYLWHAAALTGTAGAVGMASSASQWMFFLGIPPYWNMLVKSAMFSPALVILTGLSVPVLVRSTLSRAEKVALGGLLVIVLTPFYYKNTAGYFYVFMFAPVAAGCALAVQQAVKRYSVKALAIFVTAIAGGVFLLEDRSAIHRQYEVVAMLEESFPQHTAYFDHNGMAPWLDKANYLMTPSAMSNYRAAGVPVYRQAMEQRVVPVLLANWWTMRLTLETDDDSLLLPEDLAAWRGNYIPFWGPVYVAGKALAAGETRASEEFLVPGSYTVLDAPVELDKALHQPGDVIEIARGFHRIAAPQAAARLQWGNRLSPPAQPFDEGPIYVGF